MSIVAELISGSPVSSGRGGVTRYPGSPGGSAAGVSVNEDQAMMVGAAYACISFIARNCGAFPRRITLRDDASRRDVRLAEFKHVWGDPHPDTTGLSFWESTFAAIEGWGNGFIWNGRTDRLPYDPARPWRGVRHLEFMQPRNVSVGVIAGGPNDGAKGFAIGGGVTQQDAYTAAAITHIPGLSLDGIRGASPVRYAANALGLSIAAERFGSLFFRNGSSLSGVIVSKAEITGPQALEIAEEFNANHQGVNQSHLLGVFGGDAHYEKVGIPPNEAQFLETRIHQREEVVSFYGPIPHHLLGWKSNTSNYGSGIEQQNLGLLIFVLLNRLRRVEEIVEKYLLPPEMQFRFVVSGLLRGDLKTQAAFMQTMRNLGVYSADRILDLLDEAPRGIPDDYLYAGNMQRLATTNGNPITPTMGQPAAPARRAAVALAEPKCPSCDARLPGSNVVTATLWCRRCKAEQRIVEGAFVQAVPPAGATAAAGPRDGHDFAEMIATELSSRL